LDGVPPLTVPVFGSTVRKLTIGSVLIDTHEDRGPVSYMCRETGIGSGSIYYESKLFASKADADAHASAEAASKTVEAQAEPAALEAKHFASLRIDDANREAARSAIFHSWYAYIDLKEKVNDFLQSEEASKDDLRSEMEWKKSYDRTNSSHPFDVLVRAARKHVDDPDVAKALEPFDMAEVAQTCGDLDI